MVFHCGTSCKIIIDSYVVGDYAFGLFVYLCVRLRRISQKVPVFTAFAEFGYVMARPSVVTQFYIFVLSDFHL